MTAGIISAAALLAVTAGVPQGLGSDAGWHVKAVQQYLQGQTPLPNYVVMPSPSDLTVDAAEWIFWWAPGTSLLTLPLMAGGLPPGLALRMLAAAAILAAITGWCRWFGGFGLPRPLLIAVAVLLPWNRQISQALFIYTPEALALAATPWLLLLADRLARRSSAAGAEPVTRWLIGGLILGSAYWLKYSALLVPAAAVCYLALDGWRRRAEAGTLRPVVALAAGFAVPVALLWMLNHRLAGEANLLTTGTNIRVSLRALIAAVGNPALAAADLEATLNYLLAHPSRPLVASHASLEWIGLPAGCLLVWLALAGRRRSERHELAFFAFAWVTCALALIWSFSNHVSFEARHFAASALAVLPVALQEGWRRARGGSLQRVAILSTAGVFLVVPALYGPVAVAAKVLRAPAWEHTGPAALDNTLLADEDVGEVVNALGFRAADPGALWYVTDPITALDIPGRTVIRHADFLPTERLAEEFRTSGSVQVNALLPRTFEGNGKGRTIRRSFPGAGEWLAEDLPGTPLTLWVASVAPGAGPTAVLRADP